MEQWANPVHTNVIKVSTIGYFEPVEYYRTQYVIFNSGWMTHGQMPSQWITNEVPFLDSSNRPVVLGELRTEVK